MHLHCLLLQIVFDRNRIAVITDTVFGLPNLRATLCFWGRIPMGDQGKHHDYWFPGEAKTQYIITIDYIGETGHRPPQGVL